MTRIYFFLYLTTIVTFALLAAGGNSCSKQYPYAYNNGEYCCRHNWEKDDGLPRCKGRILSYSSACCLKDEFTQCKNKPCENYGVCKSEGCKAFSKLMTEMMDLKANPCNDMEEYACGNYLKTVKIPDAWLGYMASWSPQSELIFNRSRYMLEKVPTTQSKFHTDTLASNLYLSCMNQKQIEDLKLSPIQHILDKHGGWPAVVGPSWNVQGYDLWKHVLGLAAFGISTDFILAFAVDVDERDNSRATMYLDQPKLGMHRTSFFKDKLTKAYHKFMVDSAMLMGAKRDTADKDMKEVLQFETELAKISATREDRRDLNKLYNKRTLRDFEGKPGYPPSLVNYINTLFTSARVSNVIVDENDEIIVKDLEYVENLSAIILCTSDRTLANYLSWRAYKSKVQHMHEAAKSINFDFRNATRGVQKPLARYYRCVIAVGIHAGTTNTKRLSIAGASLYARKYFPKEDKRKAEEIASYTEYAFRHMLKNLDWMDRQTKDFALQKLDRMKRIIGYTDEIFNQKLMDKFHEALKMDGNYFNNMLELNLFWRNYNYKRLKTPVDKDHWIKSAVTVMANAIYLRQRNVYQFSSGVMAGLFFDTSLPLELNYPTMGTIVGHEVLHGFDDEGSQYDSEGKLFNWWKNSTKLEFKKRTGCIIKQYGNYTHPQVGLKVNGISTQGENIADGSGLIASYRAFENYTRLHEPALVDGHYFSPEQWFWIRYAQLWCGKWRDQSLKNIINSKPHAPSYFRVIGPIANNPDFPKAFQCPSGSRMNPVKKCRVW